MTRAKGQITGSGWGKYVAGRRITKVWQVKVGDILLEHSRQFHANNIVRVTQTRFPVDTGTRFYCRFVDPDNHAKPRRGDDHEMCIWQAEIAQSEDEAGLKSDFFRPIAR